MWRFVLSYLAPKRWRSTSYLAVLFMVAFLVLVSVLKERGAPNIDLGCDYELTEGDVIVTPEELGISYCPVCFGLNQSVCEGVLHSTVKLRRKKRTTSEDNWKPRAVGVWNEERISIKHLGNVSEFYKLDIEMCSVVGKINAPCAQDVVWKSFLNPSSVER